MIKADLRGRTSAAAADWSPRTELVAPHPFVVRPFLIPAIAARRDPQAANLPPSAGHVMCLTQRSRIAVIGPTSNGMILVPRLFPPPTVHALVVHVLLIESWPGNPGEVPVLRATPTGVPITTAPSTAITVTVADARTTWIRPPLDPVFIPSRKATARGTYRGCQDNGRDKATPCRALFPIMTSRTSSQGRSLIASSQ